MAGPGADESERVFLCDCFMAMFRILQVNVMYEARMSSGMSGRHVL